MTDTEYLTYLNERIKQASRECDHYASCGLLTPEWAIDDLYRFTDERNKLIHKMKMETE